MPLVKWSLEALRDIERLHQFLKPRSVQAAARAIAAIRAAARTLEQFPDLAQPLTHHMREHFAPFGAGAYVLRYRIDASGDVFILRVWHSREDRS